MNRLSVACLACLSCAALAAPPPADPFLAAIDRKIERLNRVAGSYPPAVANTRERKQVLRECSAAVASLQRELTKHPANWEIEWRLGECYRIGHNLDIKNAWKQSEAHLKKAIRLRPKGVKPYLILGMLYVNSDLNLAPEAEKLFRKALQLSGAHSLPDAHQGLVFACYYQGKFEEALKEADACLALRPNDSRMRAMREVIRKVVKRSGEPQHGDEKTP